MSYNMNFGEDFYSKRGDSKLEFADIGNQQQYYDPNVTAYPTSQNTQYQQSSQTFYADWATQQNSQMTPSYFTPSQNDPFGAAGQFVPQGVSSGGVNQFEQEPPLLEELGINFDHIYRKTKCVLNPFAKPHESILHDEDLAGPLVFCIAYGFSLLLMGKIQFGYIYGITALGCFCMYALLNLMSEKGVNAACIGSILGYCLLPMVILSFLSTLLALDGLPSLIVSILFILWCSISSSKLFVYALSMNNQQALILYPCFLLYGILALLNVF